MAAGDRVAASLRVDVPRELAFRLFTEEIDLWWRQGLKFRAGARARSVLHLEPRLGGRLFEELAAPDATGGTERADDALHDAASTSQVVQTGEITAWSPPAGFTLRWRAANFAAHESTVVDVRFEPQGDEATLVTVVHSGWAALPPDHPVRHGEPVPAFIARRAMWWGELLAGLRRHVAEHHGAEHRGADPHGAERHEPGQHVAEQQVAAQRVVEQHVAAQHVAEQHVAAQHVAEQHVAAQHVAEQPVAERQLAPKRAPVPRADASPTDEHDAASRPGPAR